MKAPLVVVLALASVAQAWFVNRDDGCPLPYERLDATRCIYPDPFQTMKYNDAVDHCKSHGGTLLTYDNCHDVLLIYDFLQSDAILASKSYWLGATDEAEEGTWVFTHNQQPVPLGNPFWKNGEPSVSTSYNCAILSAADYHRWTDSSCTSSLSPICLRDG